MPRPQPRVSTGPRIIVVGAGAIGLFCAARLAARGGAVTVVEADAAAVRLPGAPRAASFAAAGMLGPYSEVIYEGPSHHRRLTELGAASLALWRDAAATSPRMGALYRPTGALLLAHDDAEEARLRRVAVRAGHMGVRHEWFDELPDDLDLAVYGARVRGAVRLPDEALIDAAEALQSLEQTVVAEGGSILRERTVAAIEVAGGRVDGVRFAEGGGLAADMIVLATGALAEPEVADICPALSRVTPAKGALGVAQPQLDEPIFETIRSPSAYVTPGRLGEIVFGATMEFGKDDLEEDPAALDRLFKSVRRLLPGVRFDGPPQHYSAGLRPMTPDWAPLVGPSGPDGLIAACGHGRNGWLLAPITAQMVCAYVFDEPIAPLWGAFNAARFDAKVA